MKKIFYVITMLSFIMLFSCQEEQIYSCNEEENAWVKQNLDEIRTMSRSNWLEVDESMKRSVYRAFTSEQKQSFWKEKIQKILIEHQWTPEECSHLQLLEEAVDTHIEWFDKKGVEQDERVYDEFKIFAYEWLEYATSELKWPEVQIAAIVASGNDLKIINGEIVDNWTIVNNKRIQTRSELPCDCKASNVVFTTCSGSLNRHCRSGGCDEIRDCGFLTAETCDGICDGL